MFFNPFMLKRTPQMQFEVAYINHVNRDPSPESLRWHELGNALAAWWHSQVAFVQQMQSEEKWLLTIFSFSQAPTPTLVLASVLSQPKYLLYTKVFAKLCIVWCIYISIILGDSSLHAGVQREAQGSYNCWPAKVQQVFHSPCCEWPCRFVTLVCPLPELEMSTHSNLQGQELFASFPWIF